MRRSKRLLLVGAFAALVGVTGCVPPPPAPGQTPVMGGEEVNGIYLVAWFNTNKPPDGPYISVPIEQLVTHFVLEGRDEHVRGDIAFAQSIVETGWFRYGGQVQWWQNNFAGIGAVDGGGGGAAFPDAQTGVRAQIQHLRAYADPFATTANLGHPCVDPRFDLVSPKGKAPFWNMFGNGIWATSPTYASTVLDVYNSMRAFAGLPPV